MFRLALVATALVIGIAPAYAVAGAKSCGSFDESSVRVDVTRSGAETCGHALRIVKSFIRDHDSWKQHGDGVLYRTHWTNKKFPKWRCAQGSGGGSCSRGKKMALYSSTYVGDEARSLSSMAASPVASSFGGSKLPKVVTGRFKTAPQTRPSAIFHTGNFSGALGGSGGSSVAAPGALTWRSYTRKRARADGVLWFKACLDSCADGSIGSAPAVIELDRPRRNRFTRLTVRYSSRGVRIVDRRKPSSRYDGYEIISTKELGPDRLAGCEASGGPDDGEWSVSITGSQGNLTCDEAQQLIAHCAANTLSGWTVVQNASGIRFSSADEARGFTGDVAGATPACATIAIYATNETQ